jgi:hypothetical protein
MCILNSVFNLTIVLKAKIAVSLILISCIITSCATIFNSNNTDIIVRTPKPSTVVYTDSIKTRHNRTTISVPRQSLPIELTVITDSVIKKVKIKPFNSIAYYWNAENFFIGMYIERNKPKRWTFPHKVFIDPADSSYSYRSYGFPTKKGDIAVTFSLPYINTFHLTPDGYGVKNNTGFMGISGGLNYYHNNRQFINISVLAAADIFIPFPAAVDHAGEVEQMNTMFLSVSNNHVINQVLIGYGITYTRNEWNFSDYGNRFGYKDTTRSVPLKDPVTKTNDALGFVFSSHYKIGNAFNVGVIYRPTFLRLNTADHFKYEHLISVDLAWEIKLFNLTDRKK